jgi:Transcriptional regulator PadR-like family
MSTQEERERLELLQGTLDLLILRTLIFGPQHGQGVARAIQQTSEHELLVEHGALYPALQPLEERGWISAKWGTSATIARRVSIRGPCRAASSSRKRPVSGTGLPRPWGEFWELRRQRVNDVWAETQTR